MSVLIFFVVLFVLVLVHEWGHFIVAKKTGMRVDEFGIGFPPKITGIKRGETEYTLNWLPIGGFVRIFGENYEDAEQSEADKQDAKRAFAARPKWAQALVLVAGVTMNIILAWFLFVISFMIGIPTAVDEMNATPEASLHVAGTLPEGPASVLPNGAEIISVSSADTELQELKPKAFSDFVSAVAPAPMTITYEYKGDTNTVDFAPIQGLDTANPERYVVGVSLALIDIQRASFIDSVVLGTQATYNSFMSIIIGIFTLIGQSFSGDADYSQVAGPIGIVEMVGDAASFGLTALLTFTAIISLNLAVINLLPVPALDGGRLLFVLIETIRKKPIPAVWAARVNLTGFALLMLLMLAVTFNDIIRMF